jgi:hypothetical protein
MSLHSKFASILMVRSSAFRAESMPPANSYFANKVVHVSKELPEGGSQYFRMLCMRESPIEAARARSDVREDSRMCFLRRRLGHVGLRKYQQVDRQESLFTKKSVQTSLGGIRRQDHGGLLSM